MPRSPRRLFVTALLAVALSALPSLALGSHSWGSYHWARTSNPFTLKVGDNVTGTWDDILKTTVSDPTVSDWSDSTVLNLQKVAGSTRAKPCKPTTGRVEVCNASYGNNGWLGIAQIWITGGTHIVQGITKVNDYYFNQPAYNTTAWRNLVMCQEVGHTLGLDHQDENFNNANLGTCMDYTSNPGPNQYPNAHDYVELENIYRHLDSTTTVLSVTSGFGNASGWGQLMSSSARDRTSIYRLDLGSGQSVITHVIWAL